MTRRNRVPDSVSMETPQARKAEEKRRRELVIGDHPSISARDPARSGVRPASLPEALASRLPTGASRDAARMVLHGLARTGNTILKAIDIPNRVFGNSRSLLQDIYEKSEESLARDAYEDRSGAPQVGEAAVHLASAGVLGKALPAVFGANVGADTYETAKYAGASEGEALAKGVGHGVVDTAIWTLGQGLSSKLLPKAWQWLGRTITGAGRGAVSSVTSDAVLNSLGADIGGDEMAKRAVHAAWMVPLLGMLKMGGKRREEAMSMLRKARPDLAGAKAGEVIDVLENEFSDAKSQKVALAWVARKGANLPDDLAQIQQALEVSSKVKGLDPMSKSPFEILSDPAYARYLPKPKPQDVKAFSNMKRYPMGVIGFDVSDDAAGRQATREMINAYMSPSSNPWCLATGKDAKKLGELGPNADSYWKQHSAVPKQIFFQEVDGKLELTAFRATKPGGEGRQEYWDTSDAGYSGIPLKVKVPGDPLGRYQKTVFRPKGSGENSRVALGDGSPNTYSASELRELIENETQYLGALDGHSDRSSLHEAERSRQTIHLAETALSTLESRQKSSSSGEVQGTFEDIAPGKVFKGDPFRDGRSQTWSLVKQEQQGSDGTGVGVGYDVSEVAGPIEIVVGREGGDFPTIEAARAELQRVDLMPPLDEFTATMDEIMGDLEYNSTYRRALVQAIDNAVRNSRPAGSGVETPQYALVEDKVRTTENGITKFRTTRYPDPEATWDYDPPRPGEQPKPYEIEESELVSPEWMRARGYDPENESDVRRMNSDINIDAYGDGMEAAMTVVPTKRTLIGIGDNGTSETLTYGPNGRDVVSIDFTKGGVPYRKEYFQSGPKNADPSVIYNTFGPDAFPDPRGAYIGGGVRSNPTGLRLVRNPDSASPEVLNEIRWDEGLGSFVRTSRNRRWRTEETLDSLPGISTIVVEDRQPDGTWAPATGPDVMRKMAEPMPPPLELPPPPPEIEIPETMMDAKGGETHAGAKAGGASEPPAKQYSRQRLLDHVKKWEKMRPKPYLDVDGNYAIGYGSHFVGGKPVTKDTAAIDEATATAELVAYLTERENTLAKFIPNWSRIPSDRQDMLLDVAMGKRGILSAETSSDLHRRLGATTDPVELSRIVDEEYPTYSKAGGEPSEGLANRRADGLNTLRVRQDSKGGDTLADGGDEGEIPPQDEGPVPARPSGPRIVINPTTFRNRKDALCVAFNERFRIAMEQYGFEPRSEPTPAQRRFFADTAYADDEVQLRRTILARILTLDTSIS